jgi:hypothetical protein
VGARPLLRLTLPFLGFAGPTEAAASSKVSISGVDAVVQLESAIGQIPGHWALSKQGFRDRFLPDSGYGNGVYSVPLHVPTLLAFNMDSGECVPCALVKGAKPVSRHVNGGESSYACGGFSERRAFFLASAESVGPGMDPGWVESREPAPRFQVSNAREAPIHFHEWITTKEISPGKRLACGAWFEGAYPPEKAYNELRGDTVDVADYVILDRAIYLIGTEGQAEYLFRSDQPSEAWESTFELAFLPADYSELESARFSQIHRVRGGFWLRVKVTRDFEGAGAEEGILLLECRTGGCQLLAGATEVRMY